MILGVSHLVLSVVDLDAAEKFLIAQGYGRFGEIKGGDNPREKKDFVDGPLASAFDMRLMVSRRGAPAVELLKERMAEKGPPALFENVFALNADSASNEVVKAEAWGDIPGFRRIGSDGVSLIRLLMVHCRLLDETLELWSVVGFSVDRLDSTTARVVIPAMMPSGRLTVLFREDRTADVKGVLNRPGMVCLSLFCDDTDRLAATLTERGFETSAVFSMTPFGKRFRIFFVRNKSGELYEFLSVDKEQGEK